PTASLWTDWTPSVLHFNLMVLQASILRLVLKLVSLHVNALVVLVDDDSAAAGAHRSAAVSSSDGKVQQQCWQLQSVAAAKLSCLSRRSFAMPARTSPSDELSVCERLVRKCSHSAHGSPDHFRLLFYPPL